MDFYVLVILNGTTLLTLVAFVFKWGKWAGQIESSVKNNSTIIKNLPCIKKPDEYFKK